MSKIQVLSSVILHQTLDLENFSSANGKSIVLSTTRRRTSLLTTHNCRRVVAQSLLHVRRHNALTPLGWNSVAICTSNCCGFVADLLWTFSRLVDVSYVSHGQMLRICCRFVVQHVVRQIHNKSKSLSSILTSTCTTDRCNGVRALLRFVVDLLYNLFILLCISWQVFTARCYAYAVLAMMDLCLSVSVCLSQVGVLGY